MKKRIQLIIIIFSIALLIISTLMITTNQQIERLNKQAELITNIELKIVELSNLSDDFLMSYPSSKTDQWESKYASITEDVLKLDKDRPDQHLIIDNIMGNQHRLKKIFDNVALNFDKMMQTYQNKRNQAFFQVAWNNLDALTQRIVIDASHLSQKLNNEEEQRKQINNLIIFIIMGAMTAFLLTNYLLIFHRKSKVDYLLASEREFLKVTINSLGEGVVAVDQEERIIFINEAAANLIGHSLDKVIGQPLNKILYIIDDKTSEVFNQLSNVPSDSPLILVTRDLREVMISINSSLIKANEGQIIGTVIVLQDITEKLKVEQELLKTAKLDSLGILAGGVAHDFNNILAGILANLQLANLKIKKHQDISNYMENTIEITRKASALTKQLLTFAKGGDPVKKSVEIANLVKDTTQFALSGSKVKPEYHLPDNLWVVDIDEGQISQVINNLTINAEQAMPTGGILEIYGENVVFENVEPYKPGRYVKLTVRDHGIGIPPEIIDKIFDPFFTTKKTGNGLGLSTSYSIIKKHNGYLEVESVPGIGTTFYIMFPASKKELTITESQKEVASTGDAKVLLMDDEDMIRNLGGEMLIYYGYQVTLARDGKEAIELYKKAKEIGNPFDVVVMDLTVPGGLGGLETMAILRQFDPEVKVIISSGFANDQVISEYERYGFSGVVTKPYTFDELYEVLNKVIYEKQESVDFT